MVSDVGAWWGACEGVREWVSESMGEMARERPLAGSEDIVAQQLSRVQVHDCLYYTVNWTFVEFTTEISPKQLSRVASHQRSKHICGFSTFSKPHERIMSQSRVGERRSKQA